MTRFTVAGIPIQQGSSRAFVRNGRAIITSDTRRDLKTWRRRIAMTAQRATGGRTLPKDTPVTLRLVFRMPAPQKMPKGRIAPTTTPDLDKLLRAAMDALKTGEVYEDDAQVIDAHAVKLYATTAHPVGLSIEVEWPDAAPRLMEVAS